MTVALIVLSVVTVAAAVLIGCLLYLTPRQLEGETAWERIKRSMWERAARDGVPRRRKSGRFEPWL